jgi:hypothetical protein
MMVTQPWLTADGRCFLPHFNLPHLERRVLGSRLGPGRPASSADVPRLSAKLRDGYRAGESP